jgi:hypothetical protein
LPFVTEAAIASEAAMAARTKQDTAAATDAAQGVAETDDGRRPASELWLVDGKYYDLRPMYAKHPGGEFVLRQCMGSDCSVHIRCHHVSNKPFTWLPSYVAEPREVPDELNVEAMGKLRQTNLEYSFKPDGFYTTLRGRVAEYFKQHGIHHPQRAGPYTLCKLAACLVAFAYTWAHICTHPFSLPVALINAVLRFALTGMGHDAIHNNMTPQWPSVSNCIFPILGCLTGMNPRRWHYIHVVLHHPHTKTSSDPEEEKAPMRLTTATEWQPAHKHNVLYQWIIGPRL